MFAALMVVGYAGYRYTIQHPPLFIAEILKKLNPAPPLPPGPDAPLNVPQGFRATIFSRSVPGARAIIRDESGSFLVSLLTSGKIVALRDTDSGASEPQTVLDNLRKPHGLALRCEGSCTLYVAEEDAVRAYRYDGAALSATLIDTVTILPAGSGHFTRTLGWHPDGRLLVTIGSSCNVCIESEPHRASISAIDLATKQVTPFATGLRNAVFFTTHPVTGDLWATDNGRDFLGDDLPPDEVNIVREGSDYGWPYCYGKKIRDDDFAPRSFDCSRTEASHLELPAHAAALGLAFIPEEGWPEDMWHDLLVAFHGSWNRSSPAGYSVVRINLDPNGNPIGPAVPFVTGFLPADARSGGEAIGRPVALLAEPGGVLYVTDDKAGAIYKVIRTTAP